MLSSKYDDFLIGDFNSQPTEEAMESFCQIHNSHNLHLKLACYKSPTSHSSANLIMINKPRNIGNSCTFETGLSCFHKTTLTVLKSSFAKLKLRILNYRNYKFVNNILFRDQILSKLSEWKMWISDKDLKHFKETYFSV